MASRNKVIEMIGAIKTIYPYYAKEGSPELIVNSWDLLLKEYPDSVVEEAFTKCLKKCKLPPTPADVVEEIENKTKVTAEDAAEYWLEYVSACRKAEELTYYFPFTFVEANGKTQGENARNELMKLFDNLSAPVKKYVGSVGLLIEKGRRFDFDELRFEKSGFMKEIVAFKKPALALNSGKTFEALLEEG